MMGDDFPLLLTVSAADFYGRKFRFNTGAFGNGSLRKHIQINLNAVRNNAPELADTQVYDPDFRRVLRFRVSDTVCKQMLSDTQFVHIRHLPAGMSAIFCQK